MLRDVKKVEYIEEYKLKLYFDNKAIRIVDLKDMLKDAKNMFLPLADVDYFKQVECDGTTICWPNGVDLCPDVLYKMGKPAPRLKSRVNPSKQISKSRKKAKADS